METMRLVEKHVIRKESQEWKEIDDLPFKSKNLYNRANYEIRQHFFETNQILSYNEMASRMQTEESYCALPRKVSQQVLRCLDRNWKAWVLADSVGCTNQKSASNLTPISMVVTTSFAK